MISEIQKKVSGRMEGAMGHLQKELANVRTGRASLAILDSIRVDYYGSPTPLRQIAALSVPESHLITIQPWEPNLIAEIEKALLASDLGITPGNDGKVIRLNVPALTEDRRKDLVKHCKKNRGGFQNRDPEPAPGWKRRTERAATHILSE